MDALTLQTPPPGRGAAESAETPQRLLDAAEELFAARGYDGASVREITQRAGCNLAAINYYFDGKTNLYRAVFERRLTALRTSRLEAIARAREERADLEGLLRVFAEAFLEPFVAADGHCLWVRLYSREILDPRLPRGLFYEQTIGPTHDALAAAVREVCPRLDRATALRSVQSLIGQLLHVRHLLDYGAACDGARRESPFNLRDQVDHVVRFSAAAIRHLESCPT